MITESDQATYLTNIEATAIANITEDVIATITATINDAVAYTEQYIPIDDMLDIQLAPNVVTKTAVNDALLNFMSELDDIKQSISDDSYLTMSNTARTIYDYIHQYNAEISDVQLEPVSDNRLSRTSRSVSMQSIPHVVTSGINLYLNDLFMFIKWIIIEVPFGKILSAIMLYFAFNSIFFLKLISYLFPVFNSTIKYLIKIIIMQILDFLEVLLGQIFNTSDPIFRIINSARAITYISYRLDQ